METPMMKYIQKVLMLPIFIIQFDVPQIYFFRL